MGFTWDSYGIYMGFIWDLYGFIWVYMGLYGIHMGFIWDIMGFNHEKVMI
jgi:hypothetical protein